MPGPIAFVEVMPKIFEGMRDVSNGETVFYRLRNKRLDICFSSLGKPLPRTGRPQRIISFDLFSKNAIAPSTGKTAWKIFALLTATIASIRILRDAPSVPGSLLWERPDPAGYDELAT
jgi:hypothetical protein